MVQPRILRSCKPQGAMERTVGASGDAQRSSYCSARPRLSFPAAVDAHVRTGERWIDAISPGGTLSVPGLADRELSSGASAVSLVLRKNPSAGGHGPAHPRTPSTASENAARGRSGLGPATENRRREVKSDSVERRFGSLHGALSARAARW